MSVADVITAMVVLLGAGWLLVRSIRKSAGGCHGCGGSCHGVTPEPPPVTLRRKVP